MRHTRHATEVLLYTLAAAWVTGAVSVGDSRSQSTQIAQQAPVLDLTARVSSAEQGFPGIPGASFGGPVGMKDISRYQLPLEVQVASVASTEKGDLAVQVMLRNTGKVDFQVPRLRNLTAVERTGNRSQRILFFRVEAVFSHRTEPANIGFAAVGSTTSIPSSSIRLGPGQALKVLLPVSSEELTRVLNQTTSRIKVRVTCDEWQLEDSRYFIKASSEKTISTNALSLVVKDGKIVIQEQ